MIGFAFPWAFALLPLPWLVWRFLPPRREQVEAVRVPFFRRIAEAAGIEPKAGSVVLRRRRLQMIAAILVWGLLVTAMARPERIGEPIEIEKSSRDVILAIDISGSMDARDFAAPDGTTRQRLEAVKDVVGRFVAEREGDRVALIVFGAKAFVQSPFTEDLRTVQELLDDTEVGMAGPATVLGDAIGLALNTFEASEIEERLLILLSDGTDTGSRMSPVNAAEIAASKGVRIFTIGVGDPEASGEDKVDLDTLRDVATRAGGEFFFAEDEAALDAIYSEIDGMTPRAVETLSWSPKRQLAHLPLGLAALIVLAVTGWLALGTRRRRSAA